MPRILSTWFIHAPIPLLLAQRQLVTLKAPFYHERRDFPERWYTIGIDGTWYRRRNPVRVFIFFYIHVA